MRYLAPLVASGALLLALPVSAQELTIGSPAPELHVTKWIQGEPVRLQGAGDNQAVVVEFWATWCGPCIASIPHLTELQERFANAGVRIVGLTTADPNNTLDKVEEFVASRKGEIGYAIAFDADGKTRKAYMEAAGENGIPCCFVIDKNGKIAWIGHPMAGLDQVIEDVVAGTHDLAFAKKVRSIQRRLDAAFDDQDMDAVLACADELLAAGKDRAPGWMARFQAYQNQKRTAKLEETVTQALQALKSRPGELVRFVESCVLPAGDDSLHRLAIAALEPLQEQGGLPVRVACFELLDACGMADKALQAASAAVRTADKNPRELGRLAATLATSKNPRRYAEAASSAIEKALMKAPESLELLRARFQVEAQCKNDLTAANRTGERIIELLADNAAELNNFAWELLTEPATKGRFQRLALHAAEAMAKAKGGDQYFMLDTLALAKFENGMIDEAIELQKKAIERGGKGNPEYEARLQKYLDAKKAKGPDRRP